MMRVAMATEPGSPNYPNEDFVGATANGVVLLDGAGSYGLDIGCAHGVAWYAHQLGAQLLARMGNAATSLTDVLARAIEAVAAIHVRQCDLNHPGTPSATVVLLRDVGEAIDYLVLADSVLLLVGPGGEVEAICDAREATVGDTIPTDAHQLPTGSLEHRPAVATYVDALRAHRVPGGFWLAANEPAAACQALVGRRATSGVHRATLLSDGASRLVDRFELATWEQLHPSL